MRTLDDQSMLKDSEDVSMWLFDASCALNRKFCKSAWIFTSHRHRTFCICYVTILSKVHSLTNIRGYNSHVAGNAIVNLLAKLSTMKRFSELNLSRLKLGKPVVDSLCKLAGIQI
ncbi:hypothetical protein K1719_047331 [Acacia pycnantha]|nr:hypothetical protein K1719_047331 [Acacia pycnantha]